MSGYVVSREIVEMLALSKLYATLGDGMVWKEEFDYCGMTPDGGGLSTFGHKNRPSDIFFSNQASSSTPMLDKPFILVLTQLKIDHIYYSLIWTLMHKVLFIGDELLELQTSACLSPPFHKTTILAYLTTHEYLDAFL